MVLFEPVLAFQVAVAGVLEIAIHLLCKSDEVAGAFGDGGYVFDEDDQVDASHEAFGACAESWEEDSESCHIVV
jgi:hypothetical protein